jgi:alpha-N-arabinofuranosidase
MITTNVGAGNFFVKTKDPFGKWSEPIWLKDVRGIDPSFFFDDNGHAYILNNDEPEGKAMYDGHRAIWIQEFDVNTDKAFGPRKVLINGGIHFEEKPIWIEGPHMYKIKGKYFLMDAEGGTSVNHSEVILTGTDPMGEFKPCEKNPILTQRHLNPNR